MEGERQPPAAASAAVSKVLDDDDLLIEIIIRVAFPTSLVRAALVCKRWLRHVSDPKFLRRFCKIHLPTLLGFYVNDVSPLNTLCFIPMLPQPPELTAVIRRASFSLDSAQKVLTYIRYCRNGSVFTTRLEGREIKHRVYNPLFPERGMPIIPPSPCYKPQNGYYGRFSDILSVEEGDDLSYLYVLVESNMERTKSWVHVCMLRPGDGVWRTHLTLAIDELYNHWDRTVVLRDNKIYMPGFPSDIVVMDLKALSFSTIRLPQGVEYGDDTMLSQADDAPGVYLFQAKELQLRIWLHKCDNWLLVDTICLREMCANLRMSECTVEDEHISVLRIKQVGDNAEFAFFEIGQCVVYLDIKCKTMHKVYVIEKKDPYLDYHICPFKMIWPPIFPALKGDSSRNAI